METAHRLANKLRKDATYAEMAVQVGSEEIDNVLITKLKA
jgi:hypothetical protein